MIRWAKEKIDVAVRLKVDQIGDAAAARKRNTDAMSALLTAYPELRKAFHGVWVFAEAPGQNPFATEQAMSGDSLDCCGTKLLRSDGDFDAVMLSWEIVSAG